MRFTGSDGARRIQHTHAGRSAGILQGGVDARRNVQRLGHQRAEDKMRITRGAGGDHAIDITRRQSGIGHRCQRGFHRQVLRSAHPITTERGLAGADKGQLSIVVGLGTGHDVIFLEWRLRSGWSRVAPRLLPDCFQGAPLPRVRLNPGLLMRTVLPPARRDSSLMSDTKASPSVSYSLTGPLPVGEARMRSMSSLRNK